jgi:hypothetical protein
MKPLSLKTSLKTSLSQTILASLAKEYKYALSSRISGKNEFLINHKIFGERWILISWKKFMIQIMFLVDIGQVLSI